MVYFYLNRNLAREISQEYVTTSSKSILSMYSLFVDKLLKKSMHKNKEKENELFDKMKK